MEQLKNDLPFDVEGPGGPMKPPAAKPVEGGGKIPGYVEPFERCANCEYFDGQNTCNKFKAPADMDGSCPSFEDASGDETSGPEEAAEGEDAR
jgi:hypothetical protein